MKKYVLLILFTGILFIANSQILDPVKWEFDSKQNGDEAELIFTATIDESWHMYDTYLPEGGPIATSFNYEDTTLFEFIGDLQKDPDPEEVFDNSFLLTVRYFSDKVIFIQKIKLLSDNPIEINGYINYMCCDDETCLPPEDADFSFSFNNMGLDEIESSANNLPGSSSGQSLWLFIIISFLAGLAAIVTPCVFPMIPMTVSFFMRGSTSRRKSILNGFLFWAIHCFYFHIIGGIVFIWGFWSQCREYPQYTLDTQSSVFCIISVFCHFIFWGI